MEELNLGKGKRKKLRKRENYEEKIFCIHENHEILDVSKFWDIHQIMREDFYLLSGLKYALKNIFIIEKSNNSKNNKLVYDIDNIKERGLGFIEKVDLLSKEFSILDNCEMLLNKENINDNYTTESIKEENVQEVEKTDNLEELYCIMIECIKLSEKIEGLCKEILDYILKVTSRNNEILSEKEDDLKSEFIYRKMSEHFKFGLDTNLEQDKIINYEFICKSKEISKKISNKYNLNISSSGILIKKNDSRYINNIFKERIINEYTEIGNILSKCTEIKKTKQIKLLNRILFYIAIITFAFQLLSFPSNYMNFCNSLGNFITKLQINYLLLLIFILTIIILVISELTIFKENKK